VRGEWPRYGALCHIRPKWTRRSFCLTETLSRQVGWVQTEALQKKKRRNLFPSHSELHLISYHSRLPLRNPAISNLFSIPLLLFILFFSYAKFYILFHTCRIYKRKQTWFLTECSSVTTESMPKSQNNNKGRTLTCITNSNLCISYRQNTRVSSVLCE
jgi:hypothetical protein